MKDGIFSEKVSVLIHINKACNLRCRHCFISAIHEKAKGPELSRDETIALMKDLRDLKASYICISGGEPTLHPDLPIILQQARAIGFAPQIVTNGTRITDSLARVINEVGSDVLVSIDGPEEYHDRFRGVTGAFADTMAGIKILKDFGIRFSLQLTLIKDSLDFIEWIAELGKDLGARFVKYEPLLRSGRAVSMDTGLDFEEIQNVASRMGRLHEKYMTGPDIRMGINDTRLLQDHPCNAFACSGHACHRKAGEEPWTYSIMPDGTVMPFDPNLDRSYAMGNIRQKCFKDILYEYLGSKNHQRLVTLCKQVYKQTITPHPFPVIPWFSILAEASHDNSSPERKEVV